MAVGIKIIKTIICESDAGGWKKDTMDAKGPDGVKTHNVTVKGVWVVHKNLRAGKGWMITHKPSLSLVAFDGYSGSFYKKKEDAQRAVDQWIEEMPELKTIGKNGEFSKSVMLPFLKRMREISVSITSPAMKKDPPTYQDIPEPTPIYKLDSSSLRSAVKAVLTTTWKSFDDIDRQVRSRYSQVGWKQISDVLKYFEDEEIIRSRRNPGAPGSEYRLAK